MSIKDVRDLFAYLRTTTPVPGHPPPNALAFPFSIRRAVGVWKLLYMPRIDHPLAVDPDGLEARGRYLVEGPGHCAECHSPRTFLGGVIENRRLTGGVLPNGKKTPNITAAGLKDWSETDISDALSTGLTPSGELLAGAMAEVVRKLQHAATRPRGDRALPQELQPALAQRLRQWIHCCNFFRGVGADISGLARCSAAISFRSSDRSIMRS